MRTFTPAEAQALIDELDDAGRDALRQALGDPGRPDESVLVDAVAAWMVTVFGADDAARIVGVVIGADEYDNGYFLDTSLGDPVAVYIDGSTTAVATGDSTVDDLLTDTYGAVGARSGVAISLRARTVEFDDYTDKADRLAAMVKV